MRTLESPGCGSSRRELRRTNLASRIGRQPLVVGLLALAFILPPATGLTSRSARAGGIPVLHIRKNVKDLTRQEKKDIVDAILRLKRVRSPWNSHFSYYDQFVWWHRNTFFCQINAAHMVPSFPVWHREFILLFENALRQVSGKPISLPYWDWTDPASTRALFSPDFMGGNGNPRQGWALTSGAFRKGNWRLNVVDQKANDPYGLHYIVRRFGSLGSAPTLPSINDVRSALRIPHYDSPPYNPASDPSQSFRNNLEGWREQTGMSCQTGDLMNPTKAKGTHPPHEMHNRVHLWVGGQITFPKNPKTVPEFGTMTLNTSLNDPVFWFHHANIDRIYWEWERRHGEQYVPKSGYMYGHNLHDLMWPYRNVGIRVSPANVLDIHQLGYDYSRNAKS